jgi:2-keto-4-pentenoate hydratase/2-oxohepta-3-ene-1,7-dioic acid hydratase in catechol pathway
MTRLARGADGRPLLGDAEGFVPLSSTDASVTTIREALSLAASDDLPAPAAASADPVPAAHLSFAAPLAHPGKLWGIGLNYADHAADLNEERPSAPASFMKPATAAVGPGGPIRLPAREITDRVTAEAELAVVVGRTCSNVDEADVDRVVAGYLPVIDVTAEDILERNPRFLTRSKSFDSFLVFGRSIVTADEVGPLEELSVRTVVDDTVVAENRIRNMMHSPRALVSFHSKGMTLEAGDVVSTGTPGAGRISPGDEARAEVDRVGSVSASVVR